MRSYKCCISDTKINKKIISLSSLLKIVAEENRLQLLCILQNGAHCVCELTDHLNMSQSLISHHLRDLKDSKLISDHKKGQRVYYSLTEFGKNLMHALLEIYT